MKRVFIMYSLKNLPSHIFKMMLVLIQTLRRNGNRISNQRFDWYLTAFLIYGNIHFSDCC